MPSHFPCTRDSTTCSWVESMLPIIQAVKLTVGGPVGVLACSFATQGFTVAGSFDAGMLDSEPGKYITRCVSLSDPLRDDTEFCDRVSQHRYSGVYCNGGDFQLRSFMSKPAVRGNLTVFKSDIAVARSHELVYVMGSVVHHHTFSAH